MDLGIDGKVAVVAAASRGLGRASAVALAGEGARLVVSARGDEALAATESALRAEGAEVVSVAADISRPEVPARLIAAAVERFGGLDIVVANAGGPPPGRALDIDDDQLDAALQANLLASVRLVKEAVPVMRTKKWGRICCITSHAVVQPIPMLALSNTARLALRGWAKTAAYDLGAEECGITLNLVCPGPHATDRMKELGGTGRMGDPVGFGQVVAFLCSQPAAFINGAALVVDGGLTLAV